MNTQPSQLSLPLQEELLTKCKNYLKVLGVEYVLKLPDGNTVESEKFRQRKFSVVRGTYLAVYEEPLSKCQPGEMVSIDCGEFDPAKIRAAACSWATKNWGTGNYVSAIDGRNAVFVRGA